MDFEEWFLSQHGKRASDQPIHQLRKELDNLKSIVASGEMVIAHCNTYDLRRTSALWAWTAAKKIKNDA